MAEDRFDDGIIVRLNADMGRELLKGSPRDHLRPAPSVRGVDLAQVGSIITILLGDGASLVTLILAKEQIASFANNIIRLIHGDVSDRGKERLRIDLSSETERISLDLETTDSSKLARVLRELANITDPALPNRGTIE